MPNPCFNNILVQFNADKNKLLFSGLSKNVSYGQKRLESRVAKIIELNLSSFEVAQDKYKIENQLGVEILTILGFYPSEALEQTVQNADAEIECLANNGDTSAQHDMAHVCIRRSTQRLSEIELDKAEKWLELAASNGMKKSEEFLNKAWPILKKTCADKIKKEKDQKGGKGDRYI